MDKAKIVRFLIVGISLTFFDFIIYSLFIYFFQQTTTFSAIISGILATILAYILHGNITWKENPPGKYGILKFSLWNLTMISLIRPFLIFIFSSLVGLYQFAYFLSNFLHLPFSYLFIEKTGIFCLMSASVMILNFTIYEKLIFKEISQNDIIKTK